MEHRDVLLLQEDALVLKFIDDCLPSEHLTYLFQTLFILLIFRQRLKPVEVVHVARGAIYDCFLRPLNLLIDRMHKTWILNDILLNCCQGPSSICMSRRGQHRLPPQRGSRIVAAGALVHFELLLVGTEIRSGGVGRAS